jgi:hypothetical protein
MFREIVTNLRSSDVGGQRELYSELDSLNEMSLEKGMYASREQEESLCEWCL